MSRKYFGTDGIRGRANGVITPELALKVGQAVGLTFHKGDHRIFDHVAGQTRVLADHDPVAMVTTLKRKACGLADLERELRRDQSVGAAPDPVRPEIFAAHIVPHATTRDPSTTTGCPKGPRIPDLLRRYNAFAANLASKNVINHYGTGPKAPR